MTNMPPLNQMNQINTNNYFKINYTKIGIRDAGEFRGSISTFEVYLEKLFSRFICKKSYKEHQLDQNNLNLEIRSKELSDKNEILKNELKKLAEDEIVKAEANREKALNDYNEFKSDPSKFISLEKDNFSAWIYGSLSVLIAIFLYFFYTSVIYSSLFMEIKATSSDVISYYIFFPYVFEEASRMGFSTLMIVIFSPFIFLGLGIAVHSTKYKYVALSFTFLLDALFAYHISEKIYEAKAINIYAQVEKFTLLKALTDINFWTIIALGFVVYILFGFLFTRFKDLISISKKINDKEAELRSKVDEYQNQIFAINTRIDTITKNISENQMEAVTIHKSDEKVFFNVHEIKRILSDYTLGWLKYISIAKSGENEINEVKSIFYNFLRRKDLVNDETKI